MQGTGATADELDPAVDPIVCSPYAEPDRHWDLDRAGRAKAGAAPLPGRRRSALLRPVPDDDATATMSMDLGGTDTENRLINDIRERVRAWRNDGIVRYCAKMATGTGKTAVMGMLIAWQTLNAVRSHPQLRRRPQPRPVRSRLRCLEHRPDRPGKPKRMSG